MNVYRKHDLGAVYLLAMSKDISLEDPPSPKKISQVNCRDIKYSSMDQAYPVTLGNLKQ